MATVAHGVAPAGDMAISPAPVGQLPPGFRFHPMDEELLNYYLKRKVQGLPREVDIIPEIDLYKFEPSELAGMSFSPRRANHGAHVPKDEWYLFSPRCRRYGTKGHRMKRTTRAGYWKSTGNDRPIMHQGAVIGYKKSLIYHLGRAPNGVRTNWVMHEYRLHDMTTTQTQEPYALCRLYQKNVPSIGDADKEGAPMQFVATAGEDHAPVQVVPSLVAANEEGALTQFVSNEHFFNRDKFLADVGMEFNLDNLDDLFAPSCSASW